MTIGKILGSAIALTLLFVLAAICFLGPGKSLLLGFVLFESVDRVVDRALGPQETHVLINQQSFHFPDESVLYDYREKEAFNKSVSAIKFEFLWPSFMPVRLASIAEHNEAKRIENYNIGYLSVVDPTAEKVNQLLSNNPNPEVIIKARSDGKMYGLDKYQLFKKKFRSEEIVPKDESYVLKNQAGAITDVIYCYGTIAPKVHPPQCEYYFVDGGLLYTVRFAENPHLKNWAEWKEKSIKYINQYRDTD